MIEGNPGYMEKEMKQPSYVWLLLRLSLIVICICGCSKFYDRHYKEYVNEESPEPKAPEVLPPEYLKINKVWVDIDNDKSGIYHNFWMSRANLRNEVSLDPSQTYPDIIELIESGNSLIAKDALGVLGFSGPVGEPAIINAIIAARTREELILASIRALGNIGDDPVGLSLPYLLVDLHSDDTQIRRLAAWAIFRIGKGNERIIFKLNDLTKDENEFVRLYSHAALYELDVDREIHLRAIIEALSIERTDFTAVQIITRIGPDASGAIPTLNAMLKNEDINFKRWIERALESISGDEEKEDSH